MIELVFDRDWFTIADTSGHDRFKSTSLHQSLSLGHARQQLYEINKVMSLCFISPIVSLFVRSWDAWRGTSDLSVHVENAVGAIPRTNLHSNSTRFKSAPLLPPVYTVQPVQMFQHSDNVRCGVLISATILPFSFASHTLFGTIHRVLYESIALYGMPIRGMVGFWFFNSLGIR